MKSVSTSAPLPHGVVQAAVDAGRAWRYASPRPTGRGIRFGIGQRPPLRIGVPVSRSAWARQSPGQRPTGAARTQSTSVDRGGRISARGHGVQGARAGPVAAPRERVRGSRATRPGREARASAATPVLTRHGVPERRALRRPTRRRALRPIAQPRHRRCPRPPETRTSSGGALPDAASRTRPEDLGLVMGGGGARAAYQVGVPPLPGPPLSPISTSPTSPASRPAPSTPRSWPRTTGPSRRPWRS